MCDFRTMAQVLNEWAQVGARLTEARSAARLTQTDLAAAVSLERTAISKIEAGERKVDSLELARMARVLRRSIDWFLSPALPAVISRRKGRGDTEDAPPDVLLDQLARDVDLLEQMAPFALPGPIAPRVLDDVEAAEQSARDLRRTLKVEPGPVWDLLPLVERAGLLGFSLDLGTGPFDGSYLRLPSAGVALVNGALPSGRRRFTLVHELGHHVFADDHSVEWVVGSDGDDRERLLNAFVIHFLMPRESVLRRWEELGGPAQPRLAAIRLAAEFGVSWTAALGHLRNLELIEASLRERLEAQRPTRLDYVEQGIVLREELAAVSLSPGFARAVLRAFRRHKLSASRAVELLRGTLGREELPPEDEVPPDSLRDAFDLP